MSVTVDAQKTGVFDPSSVAITGGTIGGAQFPRVTVGSAAAASANTAVIQAALTAGGTVYVLNQGVVYTNNTLVYGSDTRLILGANTTIRQAPGTNKTMLNSSAGVAKLAGGTSVTLTQGTGKAVTVTWAAHGKAVGDAVWISGATPSVYNGVFRVVSVTDANSFVVSIPYTTTTAISGTITAVAAVKNFHVEGGLWDYDYANNQASDQLGSHAISLYGLMDSSASNVWGGNASKFSFCICGVLNFSWRNLRGDNRSDLVKVYGPANGVFGQGLYGKSMDDAISFQTKEPTIFQPYQIAYGDVLDVDVKNIQATANTAGSVLNFYPSVDELMDRIVVDGVGGFADANSDIRLQAGSGIGVVGDLTLRNIFVDTFTMQNASVRKLAFDGLSGGASLSSSSFMVSLLSTATVRHLQVLGGSSVQPPTGNNPAIRISGVVKKLDVVGFVLDSTTASAQSAVSISAGATVGQVVVQNCYGNTGMKYAVDFTGAPTGPTTVVFRNNKFEGTGVLSIQAATTVNAVLEGNDIASASLGVIRTSANATVSIRSDGCNNIAGSLLAVPAGTPTFTVFGNDIAVDVGATGFIKTASGQYCFNSGSARGTLAQNRLVTCNGTNWVQVDAPANVY